MECTDAGTYSSIVCHYCIDVPKLVCESICASGLDQTPSNCNWSPWWAWHRGLAWALGGRRGLVLRRLLNTSLHPSPRKKIPQIE